MCSVKARRLPQVDTFHSSANDSVANPKPSAKATNFPKLRFISKLSLFVMKNLAYQKILTRPYY
jgi:hypothetical protein